MSQDPGQKYLNNGRNFTTLRHDTYPFIDPTKLNLSGKHVLITGASKGLGKATAISYAKAGTTKITLAARSALHDVAKEVKAAAVAAGHPEPNVLCVSVDVTDRASVEASVKETTAQFGDTLDILVNNAGNLSSFNGIPDTDPDEWWRDWVVNVKGLYLVTRAFWPLLLKSQLKIVLNITSVGALMLSPGSTSYSCGKLAILRFTEFINQDHGESADGVLAIAVHPGGVATDLALGMPEFMHGYLTDTPELAGDTLAWLGAKRRDWLAGRYVSADWDLEELTAKREEIVKGDLLKVRLAVNAFPF